MKEMQETLANKEQVISSVNAKKKRFIEEQFPINRLSKESYKERKAAMVKL
jgi:hypothetical protein